MIAHITQGGKLVMTVKVEKGRGYVPASEHSPNVQEIGIIPIDAVYSPVVRVRYEIEETRVGQKTNYDRLVMEIWTNGTVGPEMALVEAAKILRKHLNAFVPGNIAPLAGGKRIRPVLCLEAAAAVSDLGDGIMLAATPLLAVTITSDPRAIGVLQGAAALPWLVFTLVAGAIVDRAQRARLMVRVDLARAVLEVSKVLPREKLSTLSTTSGVTTRQRQNVQKAKSLGGELYLALRPLPHLEVGLSGNYDDARVADLGPVAPTALVFVGARIGRVPQQRGTARITYDNRSIGTFTVLGRYESTNTTLGNSLYVTGSACLTVNSGSILSPLSIDSGNSITVTNYGQPLQLGQITATSLTVNLTTGPIDQATGTNLTVSGNSSFVSGGSGTNGNITLGNATNNLGGTITASGTNVTIANSGNVSIATITATSLTVTSNTGQISQIGALTVTGSTNLTSPGNVTLANSTNQFSGPVTASGNVVSISDTGSLSLGTINATTLTVNTSGPIDQAAGTNLTCDVTMDAAKTAKGNFAR